MWVSRRAWEQLRADLDHRVVHDAKCINEIERIKAVMETIATGCLELAKTMERMQYLMSRTHEHVVRAVDNQQTRSDDDADDQTRH